MGIKTIYRLRADGTTYKGAMVYYHLFRTWAKHVRFTASSSSWRKNLVALWKEITKVGITLPVGNLYVAKVQRSKVKDAYERS